jgi:hypothetical protein
MLAKSLKKVRVLWRKRDSRRKNKPVMFRPRLEGLEERRCPSGTWYWTGGTSQTMTTGSNWEGGTAPNLVDGTNIIVLNTQSGGFTPKVPDSTTYTFRGLKDHRNLLEVGHDIQLGTSSSLILKPQVSGDTDWSYGGNILMTSSSKLGITAGTGSVAAGDFNWGAGNIGASTGGGTVCLYSSTYDGGAHYYGGHIIMGDGGLSGAGANDRTMKAALQVGYGILSFPRKPHTRWASSVGRLKEVGFPVGLGCPP